MDNEYKVSVSADFETGDKGTQLRLFGDPKKPSESASVTNDGPAKLTATNMGVQKNGTVNEVRICPQQGIRIFVVC